MRRPSTRTPPPAVSTRGRSMPATTCAFVTTNGLHDPARSFEPEAAAIPVTRTTLFEARPRQDPSRGPSRWRHDRRGPRNTPIGSHALELLEQPLRREHVVDLGEDRRALDGTAQLGLPGTYRRTAPIAQQRNTPATSPSTSPPRWSRRRMPGMTPMLVRSTPSMAARPRMTVPSSTAHARETTGSRVSRRSGSRARVELPRMHRTRSPRGENAPRRNPVEIPYSPAIPTTPTTTQSAVDT